MIAFAGPWDENLERFGEAVADGAMLIANENVATLLNGEFIKNGLPWRVRGCPYVRGHMVYAVHTPPLQALSPAVTTGLALGPYAVPPPYRTARLK